MKEKALVKENKPNKLLLFINMFWKEDAVERSDEEKINEDETISPEQKEELKKSLKRVEEKAKRFDNSNKEKEEKSTKKIEINRVKEQSREQSKEQSKEKRETVKIDKSKENKER